MYPSRKLIYPLQKKGIYPLKTKAMHSVEDKAVLPLKTYVACGYPITIVFPRRPNNPPSSLHRWPAHGRQHCANLRSPARLTIANTERYLAAAPSPIPLLLLPVFTSPHLLPRIKNTAMSEFSSCLCYLSIYGIRDPWSPATEAPSTASLVTPGHILKMVQSGFCRARQY